MQLDNLVDFEKCCKTHIFLQKSEPIQPKTNDILPKIGNYPTGPTGTRVQRRPPRAGRRLPPPGAAELPPGALRASTSLDCFQNAIALIISNPWHLDVVKLFDILKIMSTFKPYWLEG